MGAGRSVLGLSAAARAPGPGSVVRGCARRVVAVAGDPDVGGCRRVGVRRWSACPPWCAVGVAPGSVWLSSGRVRMASSGVVREVWRLVAVRPRPSGAGRIPVGLAFCREGWVWWVGRSRLVCSRWGRGEWLMSTARLVARARLTWWLWRGIRVRAPRCARTCVRASAGDVSGRGPRETRPADLAESTPGEARACGPLMADERSMMTWSHFGGVRSCGWPDSCHGRCRLPGRRTTTLPVVGPPTAGDPPRERVPDLTCGPSTARNS